MSSLLTYVMWQRWGRTGKLMPAGMVALLRWVGLGECAARGPACLGPVSPYLPVPTPPCSAAMSAFYVWNLLLFKPNLPTKQH